MKNFLKLADNVDITTLMAQLQRQPDLWNENTLRTKHPGTVHSQVSDIWVWFNELHTQSDNLVINDREVIPYRAWHCLPALRPIIFALMRQVEAVRLGRVVITRLPSGKDVSPHKDMGAAAEYFQRYQIALQCLPGNIFTIDDEKISFRTGEVWQINNRETHSVLNNSSDDRIVCIVDLRSE